MPLSHYTHHSPWPKGIINLIWTRDCNIRKTRKPLHGKGSTFYFCFFFSLLFGGGVFEKTGFCWHPEFQRKASHLIKLKSLSSAEMRTRNRLELLHFLYSSAVCCGPFFSGVFAKPLNSHTLVTLTCVCKVQILFCTDVLRAVGWVNKAMCYFKCGGGGGGRDVGCIVRLSDFQGGIFSLIVTAFRVTNSSERRNTWGRP